MKIIERLEKKKGPLERELQAAHQVNTSPESIPHERHVGKAYKARQSLESMSPMFSRFFKHLKHCGGCTGLRDQTKCKYALVCAYIEKIRVNNFDAVHLVSDKEVGLDVTTSH